MSSENRTEQMREVQDLIDELNGNVLFARTEAEVAEMIAECAIRLNSLAENRINKDQS